MKNKKIKNKKIKNKNKNIIKLYLGDGLGNQIFQYLAAKYFQKELFSDSIKFVHQGLDKDIFDLLKDNKLQPFSLNQERSSYLIKKLFIKINYNIEKIEKYIQDKQDKNFLGNKIYVNEYIAALEKNQSLEYALNRCKKCLNQSKPKRRYIDLIGYWQDPTVYIKDIDSLSKNFKNDFHLRNYKNDLKPNSYIAIHFRRGDYINEIEHSISYCSNFSFIQYLSCALNLLPSEFDDFPVVILSDDINWFKNINVSRLSNIKRNFIFVQNDTISDWLLINNARLNIISNSTFSYTAALLNCQNIGQKLRLIMPFWFNQDLTTYAKGWHSLDGSIAI